MVLFPLPALVTPFPRTFIIKGNGNNGRNPLSSPFPLIVFINEEATSSMSEEATGAINEAAIGATVASRNPPSCFFILCFILRFIFLVTLQF